MPTEGTGKVVRCVIVGEGMKAVCANDVELRTSDHGLPVQPIERFVADLARTALVD